MWDANHKQQSSVHLVFESVSDGSYYAPWTSKNQKTQVQCFKMSSFSLQFRDGCPNNDGELAIHSKDLFFVNRKMFHNDGWD